MSNITELRHRVKLLHQLLTDPYPGLASWREAYGKASESVLDFYGVNVEKIKQETWDQAVQQTLGDAERAKQKQVLNGEPGGVYHVDMCPDCASTKKHVRYTPRGAERGFCANIWHRNE